MWGSGPQNSVTRASTAPRSGAPRSVTASPALPGAGARGEAALGRLQSGHRGLVSPGGATTGVALTREVWDEQGAAGNAVPQQGQRSPLRVTSLQGHGVRARVPPGSPKRVPKPERTPAPSTSTQGTQPPPPPCRLCPHHPQPGGTPRDGPRPRAGLRSSPFFFFVVVFPLKTKRLMPRSAVSSPRNTAQKHLRRRDLPWRI